MKRFAALYAALDSSTGTRDKVDALAEYLAAADPDDAAWAVHFLIGRRPKRMVSAPRLRAWAAEAADVPMWLWEECYDAVGDSAETIALLLGGGRTGSDLPLRSWVEDRLLPLRGMDEAEQRRELMRAWDELSGPELFVYLKLLTGSFRVGVSQNLVVRALARVGGVDESAVAHRLMGAWEPTGDFFRRLFEADTSDTDLSRPYPFFLAYPLDGEPAGLGEVAEWQAEWKWDGIRAQLIRRGGRSYLWSRGEELITDRFPELAEAAALLPAGTVLDGEVLPWNLGAEQPLPFAQLQRRIGRKVLGAKILAEVPAVLLCYDLLECQGADLRELPLAQRRDRLDALLRGLPAEARARFPISPVLATPAWSDVAAGYAEARGRGAEGLMLKRLASPYRVGRRRGDWWKWKLEPYTIDAVLVYAQRGTGRRASLYTDYTFALRDGDDLVPFAKAYSGLSDAEIRKVDGWVRRNTTQKFGPVRTVRPELVFELGFEGISRSTRHRSGVAVRFPRILRWRTDKPVVEADTLDTLRALLP